MYIRNTALISKARLLLVILGLALLGLGAFTAASAADSAGVGTQRASATADNQDQAVPRTAPATSNAVSPSAGAMAFDALVVRPLSFAGTVLGSALFVVSLPFSALGGNVDGAGHRLVVEPGEFTFERPLGDFSGGRSR